MAANEQGHLENDILHYVKKKGEATQTEIVNRFKKGIDPALRKKAMHNLLITGQLVRECKKEKGSRKVSTVYRIPYKSKKQKLNNGNYNGNGITVIDRNQLKSWNYKVNDSE